jgi:urea transport system substrate-binding protein
MGKEEKVSRRGYVKYAAAGVVVVAAAAGGAYYATRPKPPTPTPMPTPTPTVTPTAKPTPTPTVEKVKIGFMAPLTGPFTDLGGKMKENAIVAVDKLNLEKPSGRSFELYIEDTQTDPKVAREAAIRLIVDKKVSVIIGTVIAGVRDAVCEVVQDHNVVFLYPTNYEGNVDPKEYPNFFGVESVANQVTEPFVPWGVNKFGEKWFFVGSDYLFPRTLNNVAKETLLKSGGEVVGEVYVPLEQSDFSPVIDRIKLTNPDVIFNSVVGTGAVAIQKQLYAAGLTEKIATLDSTTCEAYTIGMGGEVASSNFYGCQSYFMKLDTPSNKEYLDLLLSHFPDTYTYQLSEATYECFLWYGKALEATGGNTQTDTVRKTLEGLEMITPTGPEKIDPETHNVISNMYVGKGNKEGFLDVIEVFEQVKPRLILGK